MRGDPEGEVSGRMWLGRLTDSSALFWGFKVFDPLPASDPIKLSIFQPSAAFVLCLEPDKRDFLPLGIIP